MKQIGLAYFTDTNLTLIGLGIFVIFFVALQIWVFRKSQKPHYEKMAQLPLSEGVSHE
jgi:cbb3-type cytochrome oxidase subunit 3